LKEKTGAFDFRRNLPLLVELYFIIGIEGLKGEEAVEKGI
jgi:hypothetical protein